MTRGKNGRFIYAKNKWVVKEGLAYCYSENEELLFFTDVANIELFKDKPVAKIADGYSQTVVDGKPILVHRYLTHPKDDEVVDHINRCKQDNRLCNLRNTNKSVNAFNSKIRSTNTTGVTGVYFRKDTKRWTAEIKIWGKKNCLGCFATKEEAIRARRLAEEKYNVNK